ncbi:1-deoxy-D-xylulose 5-phosphate reductoisomerase [Paracholeplasma brassicae]|uniref:1-deoxy-D-xylulose 5-phosphate reductoisomerase n=1 Tax=Acholeplasma brassicae TaxID=61635 RepID=U4KPG2_9MOLU|nr:1-deoxy-D-xylulose-5-phosphate reductoisomerase [Paracholeplasma brassicae]CCV66342.1 1-deoxy-D-xylulose 5-phosphate reductoisomerase [Paracholeplasma brassicae]
MKSIYLLGATGSIGTQTLDILEKYKDLYRLVGVSLGIRNPKLNERIIEDFKPEVVCLRNESDLAYYESKYKNIKFVYGNDGLIKIATHSKKGLLINALMGSVGLEPTIAAIKSKKSVAIANKETLVMAGDLIMKLAKDYKVSILPVDSEHNAIFSCLQGEKIEDVLKITITASGGSFRDKDRDQLMNVTKEEALNHPNWKMGSKITIDSATMMNKGLEVIEAHHLFQLPYNQIKTVLHKESIVHGMVTFKDQSLKAVLGSSDMRMPILYALSYPNHLDLDIKPLDFDAIGQLTFKPMDFQRYPLLELAYQVGKKGGLYPTVMNAANEKAVELFLEGKIGFLDIERRVIEAVETFSENKENPTIEEILETNKKIYERVGS